MNLKTLIIIMAIFSLVWGVGFIVLPVFFWSLYGLTLDNGGVYISRMLGVVFFMLGLILWFARGDRESVALRAIVKGLMIGNVIGFIIALYGQLTSGISFLGWVGVAAFFLLAIGFWWGGANAWKSDRAG